MPTISGYKATAAALAAMNRASRALDTAVGRRGRGRANESKHVGETTLLPLHLPRGLVFAIQSTEAMR